MSGLGKPIFDYPEEFRAPADEGCATCGIILENDAIGNYCSPECIEYEDRCEGCSRGPTWCNCPKIEVEEPEEAPSKISHFKTVDGLVRIVMQTKSNQIIDFVLDRKETKDLRKVLGKAMREFDN